jgi:hypothetical protein
MARQVKDVKRMIEYLETIYQYYPKGIDTSDLKYPHSPENLRQWALIEDERRNEKSSQHFGNMAEVLVKYLNCSAYEDFSLRGVFDLCRKAVLYLPNNFYNEEFPCCVVNVSVVSNFYSIYFTKFASIPINTLQTDEITDSQKSLIDHFISPIIKTFFNGYKQFPMEYFNEQVPGIYSSKNYGQYATYFECLLTDDVF